MATTLIVLCALLTGFVADQLVGDPEKLPHPVVAFGKAISFFEKRWNKGRHRILKGSIMTILLVATVYTGSLVVLLFAGNSSGLLLYVLISVIVFYCLAGRTLRREVQMVFEAVAESTEKGRQQLSRIVGRDTSALTPQQIRTAALETLAENLSDGVIAPLFWFVLLGAPGMLAYKMVNTLDSMVGYKNERYLLFGRFAAKLDDVANYIPARLTSIIMLLVAGKLHRIKTVFSNAKNHASPNSGYPEAALSSILDCRFGGPNYYFGELVEKPYIGNNDRQLTTGDVKKAVMINLKSEGTMLLLSIIVLLSIHYMLSI